MNDGLTADQLRIARHIERMITVVEQRRALPSRLQLFAQAALPVLVEMRDEVRAMRRKAKRKARGRT